MTNFVEMNFCITGTLQISRFGSHELTFNPHSVNSWKHKHFLMVPLHVVLKGSYCTWFLISSLVFTVGSDLKHYHKIDVTWHASPVRYHSRPLLCQRDQASDGTECGAVTSPPGQCNMPMPTCSEKLGNKPQSQNIQSWNIYAVVIPHNIVSMLLSCSALCRQNCSHSRLP